MNEKVPSTAARPRWVLFYFCVGGLFALAGCGAGATTPHSRLVAVHNAFEGIGLASMGHITEGSLAEGNTARFPMELSAQCHTFVAFGGEGVRDIDVNVLDANGQRLAGDASHDGQATVMFCPQSPGHYTVTVRMAAGGGAYAFSSWRGAVRGAGSGNTETTGDGAGTCQQPIPIQIGQTLTGRNDRGTNHHVGSCIEGGQAPEVVYVLQLDRRQQVTVAAEQDYDGALYLRSSCADEESELACNDDDEDVHHSRLVAVLDPGTYYLFADGFGQNTGQYTLTVTGQDVPTPQEVCQNASALSPGQAVTGQTSSDVDVFQGSCAPAHGPDRVYRLEVQQESRLQIVQESDYDGVLYVRRACADAASELACNDDVEDVQHSRINTIVPPGTYYVFTDGYSANASGNFTLEADVAPVAGGGVQGDSCADAQPLTPGTPVDGNTFRARDDVASPCAVSQDGYDVVYSLNLQSRSRVRLWFDHSDMGQNSVIYVTRSCSTTGANAGALCQPGAVGEDHAFERILDRGQYYVVVDSASARAFGRFRLRAQVDDIATFERACRAAPMLQPGRVVTGNTSGGQDRFQASCAGHARSPENLYRLRITRRSLVRLELQSTTPNYDAAIYIRANCLDPSTERDCNDDAGDTQHSRIETTLEPGTYTVYVDGFSSNNQGGYSLQVTVNPAP